MTFRARVLDFDQIDSTNEEARRRCLAGECGPLWITARRQTAGRGRQGRNWASDPGNLSATYLFPYDGTPAEAARLGFSAALAVADVFSVIAPGQRVALKWPNDVLLNDHKACGILLESFGAARPKGIALAIGIGINLATHPEPRQGGWPPTSVQAEIGRTPNVDETQPVLFDRLGHWLAQAADFARIRSAWLEKAARLGDEIDVHLPGETLRGRFEDVDMNGVLILKTPQGRRQIAAADVFFPETA